MHNTVNIAVFVSGNGSNCENIIRHFASSDRARVSLVVSNRPDAFALERAKRLGVPTVVMGKSEINSPDTLLPVLRLHDTDLIVLAGFLLMIPSYLIEAFPRRIINIHPALLPKYGGKGMYGRFVHEAVKAAGEKETGITVHYVSSVCDGGEIIAQFTTPLSADDTPDTIAEKVHELEMSHFPQIIEQVCLGMR